MEVPVAVLSHLVIICAGDQARDHEALVADHTLGLRMFEDVSMANRVLRPLFPFLPRLVRRKAPPSALNPVPKGEMTEILLWMKLFAEVSRILCAIKS